MDMALKDIGITFLVGAFTVLALDWVLLLIAGINITGFFGGDRLGLEIPKPPVRARVRAEAKKTKSFDPTMTAAVFAGLSFGVGILAEDLSFKYMDSIPIPSWRSIHSEQLLGQDPTWNFQNDSRLRTLLKPEERKDGTRWHPKDLAVSLARSDAFAIARASSAAEIQSWILQPAPRPLNLDHAALKSCNAENPDCALGKNLIKAVENVYYLAKNKVYSDKNYYDEMRRIQARMEFSRSIALISFCYIAFSLVTGAVVYARRRNLEVPRLLRRTAGAMVALLLIHAAALWAYEREADEFNKRAFGYFSTMLIHLPPSGIPR